MYHISELTEWSTDISLPVKTGAAGIFLKRNVLTPTFPGQINQSRLRDVSPHGGAAAVSWHLVITSHNLPTETLPLGNSRITDKWAWGREGLMSGKNT